MNRWFVLFYGAFAYMVFLLAGFGLLTFLFDLEIGVWIDGPPSMDALPAFVVNLGWIALFGFQHSWMARPATRARWGIWLEAPIGRSTYVLASSLALGVLVLFWQPIPTSIFSFESPILRVCMLALSVMGWLLVVYASTVIDPWDLVGLRQVTHHFGGTTYEEPAFVEQGIYRYLRHPIMTGLLLAFWATPDWTVGRVLFAGGMSVYIWIGVLYEERDMVARHGVAYTAYQARVGRLWPRRRSLGWEWEER